jgi:hypothetical protein
MSCRRADDARIRTLEPREQDRFSYHKHPRSAMTRRSLVKNHSAREQRLIASTHSCLSIPAALR